MKVAIAFQDINYIKKMNNPNQINQIINIRRKERKSNIELLRIFSAIGVILLHINNPKGINYAMTDSFWGGKNAITLNVLEFLADPAVNIFILITGYFMCKSTNFSIKKPISLLLQLFVLKVLVMMAFVLIAHKPFNSDMLISTVFPQKYFVVLYIGPLVSIKFR